MSSEAKENLRNGAIISLEQPRSHYGNKLYVGGSWRGKSKAGRLSKTLCSFAFKRPPPFPRNVSSLSLFRSGLFKGSRIWGGRPRPVFLLARSVFAWDDLPPDRPTARYARKTTPRRRPSEEITWESVYEHNTHTLSWGPSTESSTK